jgi:hypothetical protein
MNNQKAMKALQVAIDDLRAQGNTHAALELLDAKVQFSDLITASRRGRDSLQRAARNTSKARGDRRSEYKDAANEIDKALNAVETL